MKNTNREWGEFHVFPFLSHEAVRPQGQALPRAGHLLSPAVVIPGGSVRGSGATGRWVFHGTAAAAGRHAAFGKAPGILQLAQEPGPARDSQQ